MVTCEMGFLGGKDVSTGLSALVDLMWIQTGGPHRGPGWSLFTPERRGGQEQLETCTQAAPALRLSQGAQKTELWAQA